MVPLRYRLAVAVPPYPRTLDKAVHADNAKQNFHDADGDQIMLMNVYNRWAETEFSQQFCNENFIQYRSMKRARDIRDQMAGLCERAEIELTSAGEDTIPVRKALCAGFFYHTEVGTKKG